MRGFRSTVPGPGTRRTAWCAAACVVGLLAAMLLDDLAGRAAPGIVSSVGAAPGPVRTLLLRWFSFFHLAGSIDLWLLPAVAFALARSGGDGGRRRALRVLLLVLGSVALAGLGSEALKVVLRRERPGPGSARYVRRPFAVETWRTSALGLPSGHAAVAAAGATAVAILSPPAAPVMLVLAGGCGLQRVLSGAHFLSDVVAGWILGWVVARSMARRLWRMEEDAASP